MRGVKDLTGQQFGRLTVIKQAGWYVRLSTGKRTAKWLCKCECGEVTKVVGSQLSTGRTKSCGKHLEESAIRGDAASRRTSFGKISEDVVAMAAIRLGFDVYAPKYGAGKVDLIIYADGVKTYIQVKSTRCVQKGSCSPLVKVKFPKYERSLVDFFIIHDAVRERFYVIPKAEVPQAEAFHLTPAYDKYINAWHLLKGGHIDVTEGDIPLSCSTDSRTSGLDIPAQNTEPNPQPEAKPGEGKAGDSGNAFQGAGGAK